MSLYYFDTSAALKLLVMEDHSKALTAFCERHAGASWVSSTLLRVEVMRTVTRVIPALAPDARDLLLAFDYVNMDDEVVDAAMIEPDRRLRSLDAIHLTTARVFGADLDALVTYDDRLIAAAGDAGLRVETPQD
ncbi:type II toxin-antitoxin system VapC family toxin [Kibdelosporangium lantanae]|uniref:Type II toxin-antitoxin system VapC family toxin n=1 Tax=Kibdelosporangium lantanae TaxID=1497396 RepID=A0ABW3MC86_9PSEU